MESVCTPHYQALCTQLGSPFSFSPCPSLFPPLHPSLSSLPCSTSHQEMSTITPQRKSFLSVLWGRWGAGEGGIYCQMSLRHSQPSKWCIFQANKNPELHIKLWRGTESWMKAKKFIESDEVVASVKKNMRKNIKEWRKEDWVVGTVWRKQMMSVYVCFFTQAYIQTYSMYK